MSRLCSGIHCSKTCCRRWWSGDSIPYCLISYCDASENSLYTADLSKDYFLFPLALGSLKSVSYLVTGGFCSGLEAECVGWSVTHIHVQHSTGNPQEINFLNISWTNSWAQQAFKPV